MGSVGVQNLRQQSRSPAVASDFLHGEVAGAGRELRVAVAGHLPQPFALEMEVAPF